MLFFGNFKPLLIGIIKAHGIEIIDYVAPIGSVFLRRAEGPGEIILSDIKFIFCITQNRLNSGNAGVVIMCHSVYRKSHKLSGMGMALEDDLIERIEFFPAVKAVSASCLSRAGNRKHAADNQNADHNRCNDFFKFTHNDSSLKICLNCLPDYFNIMIK